MTVTALDARYMARALQLAQKGLYTTDPNPRVGCVIVKNDEVISEGWHARAGEPHAEILALEQAKQHAHGATVYLTFEPCCHQGRTPPCTQALIKAGVRRVVAAMRDPNPSVSGNGFDELEQHGITVHTGLMETEAEALNPGFISRMRRHRPYVRVKLAASLDGRTALASGESQWITDEAARADVQKWRARSSAILTGIGTVLMDNPSLTVRDLAIGDVQGSTSVAGAPSGEANTARRMPGATRQPLRVVVDSTLRMPVSAQMLHLGAGTLVVTGSDDTRRAQTLRKAGAEVIFMQTAQRTIDLVALMQHLAAREVNELLVEAGATLCGALLKEGLVDELVLYYAPHIMGDQARGMFRLPALAAMTDRISLEIKDVRAVGKDWRVIARVVRDEG